MIVCTGCCGTSTYVRRRASGPGEATVVTVRPYRVGNSPLAGVA
jgi:hypothetical protein